MLSRSSLTRSVERAARRQWVNQPQCRRWLATPASGSFQYQTGDASGVKFASRDFAGANTTLALVAKAGTRYQILPGMTEGLEKFAFRSTERRSALRIIREAELLGGELVTSHDRESLIIGAKFLRDDLPYFVELLAEVAAKTKYEHYVYAEEVKPLIELAKKDNLGNTYALAVNSVHSLAFHRGLGNPVAPTSSTPYDKYLEVPAISHFANVAYAKSNVAVVANGAEHAELSKWMNEFFTDLPAGGKIEGTQSKYYGGEERIAHNRGNTMIIAFPGSSSFTGGFYRPEIAVLSTLLGGQTTIKWSPGFSLLSKATENFPSATVKTKSAIYSDAGLLYVSIHGGARDVAGAAQATVDAIRKLSEGQISKEEFHKAKALAKFKELEFGQRLWAGIELTGTGLVTGGKPYQMDDSAAAIDKVTEEQLKKAAKTLLDHKASVSSVGDLFVLPYAEELGLKV